MDGIRVVRKRRDHPQKQEVGTYFFKRGFLGRRGACVREPKLKWTECDLPPLFQPGGKLVVSGRRDRPTTDGSLRPSIQQPPPPSTPSTPSTHTQPHTGTGGRAPQWKETRPSGTLDSKKDPECPQPANINLRFPLPYIIPLLPPPKPHFRPLDTPPPLLSLLHLTFYNHPSSCSYLTGRC